MGTSGTESLGEKEGVTLWYSSWRQERAEVGLDWSSGLGLASTPKSTCDAQELVPTVYMWERHRDWC